MGSKKIRTKILTVLVGLLFMGVGVFMFIEGYKFNQVSIYAEGVVVEIEENKGITKIIDTYYYPKIMYKDMYGTEHVFTGESCRESEEIYECFKVGDKVDVLYSKKITSQAQVASIRSEGITRYYPSFLYAGPAVVVYSIFIILMAFVKENKYVEKEG